jgi:hypothetical protein
MDHTTTSTRSVPALLMAVAAPFAVIGLLATPLLFDALTHLAGL